MKHYRTAWISDLHLGTKDCAAESVMAFLRDHEFDTLYIVGDLIDVWSLRRGIYWPQLHNDVIQKLLRAGRKGARVVYIPGNHDEFVTNYIGNYGAVEIVPSIIHETADGRRLLVFHGHELDTVVQNVKWLAYVGDLGYQALLRLNPPVNWARRHLGLGYWSLSLAVKRNVKNAVSFIGEFEKAVIRYAQADGVHGVVCGHIHTPMIRKIDDVEYYNCGDWVESCSALVEDFDGHIELLTNLHVDNAHTPSQPPAGSTDIEAA
ncbi:MAG: UDP-2,3-diacylglucosamine diphosphatase [Chthoniobacteraceae bacterium]